jgi:guanylate kinase
MPPSLDTLRRRLISRGTESAGTLAVRLKNAQKEMSHKDLYRHVIVNDQLPKAIAELITLFETYRL